MSALQEEITQKTLALCVETGKMTAQLLQQAMKKVLADMEKHKNDPQLHHGKQTIRQLMKHGAGVSNIEITDQNIKAFSATAKKYGIDFALKKDTTGEIPRYLVFFKGRDADAVTAAFREFSAKNLAKEKKPSIRRRLTKAKEQAKRQELERGEKIKNRDRGAGTMTGKLKKVLLPNLPYLLFAWLFDKLCQAVRLSPGADASEKLLRIAQGFTEAFASLWLSLHPLDLLLGVAGAALVRLAVYLKAKNAKKYRRGVEYGSARWGRPEDIAPYIDPVPDWNIPLTRTESLTMTSRPKDPKTARNKNILVIGGSGSGKTRFFVKPSLLQMHSSYVVTDPKGQLLRETGKLLAHGGPKRDENGKPVRDGRGKVVYEPYRIKVLNTINFSKSMKYNPLAYVRSEKDILKLVNVIIANTKGDGEKSSEDFWIKAERLLYCALIGYIWYEAEPEEKNFITLLELINACEAREDDETYKSPVDILFDELAQAQPEHFAVKQYVKFKMAAGKTLKSILVSCGARLSPFDIKELRDIMTEDELELDTMGDRKTALFLIMSDTDTTFNFVIAMLQSQLFNLLCDKADDLYNGRLPVHVRCLLDEFANIGQIPNFDKLIATIRSREISASIILQSQSQLKTIYKDAADTIVGNCDSTLFLGGKEKSTLKEISELLGKETIDSLSQSENRGAQTSHGLSYQKLGKELMTQDEIAVMDGGKCILQLRGVRPFFSDKYDLTKHPRYKYLSDADKKNVFDVERYMKRRPAIVKPDEPFDMYELSAKELTDEPDNNSTKRKEI